MEIKSHSHHISRKHTIDMNLHHMAEVAFATFLHEKVIFPPFRTVLFGMKSLYVAHMYEVGN